MATDAEYNAMLMEKERLELQLSDMTKDRDDWTAKEIATSNRLVEALLEAENLRKEYGKLFDHCDEQGKQLGTICDERGKQLEESNRLNGEKDKAMALLVERLRGLLPHRSGTMPCSGPGCNFCDDEEEQHTEKRKCEHKAVPTFDGLGVRYKCQLCGEYISE